MTVEQLIKQLQLYDPNMEVNIEDIYLGFFDVDNVYQGVDLDGNQKVFIRVDR